MTIFRNGTLTEDVIVVQASEAEVQAPAGAKIATTGVKAATKMATRLLSQSALVPRAGWSWSKFNACLANMGVAAWAVTAISITCGFACPSTGPRVPAVSGCCRVQPRASSPTVSERRSPDMSRTNQRWLHAGFAIILASLALAVAVGQPLISPAVSWILMALLALAWLVTGVILFRREPPR